MKLAFATLGCPAWTLEQIAVNAKAMKYDGVELRGISKEHVGAELQQPNARGYGKCSQKPASKSARSWVTAPL